MLRHIHVETTLFSPDDNTRESETDLHWFLQALTQRNQDYLKQRPSTPRLYKSGVKYEAPKQFDGEAPIVRTLRDALGPAQSRKGVADALDLIQDVFGGEHFCDIGVILEIGGMDCDGIACWRAAELRQAGIAADPYMIKRTRIGGGTTYHALVRWPPFANVDYPTIEDPSLLLGMGGPARTPERNEEIRKNAERIDLIRQYGVPFIGKGYGAQPAGMADGEPDFEALIEDVLGLRGRRVA